MTTPVRIDPSEAAVAQYQHAAQVHKLAADQLKADGWDEFADEVYAFVARLERAALGEARPWKPVA